MVAVGSIMTFAGIVAYKYVFFRVSWRSIYIWSTILVTVFGMMQLVLIAQVRFAFIFINSFMHALNIYYMGLCISGMFRTCT